MNQALTEQDYIALCKSQIQQKLNWTDAAGIKQRDFEYLASEIFKKTQIELSTTTLRRIWSNQYKSVPQSQTLNALAQFLEAENWNDFKRTNVPQPEVKNDRSRPVNRKYLVLIPALAVLLLVAFLISSQFKPITDPVEVKFYTDEKVYENVPATVGFHYDISGVEQPVEIELSWNPYERVVLDKAKNFYTGVYFYPDYHYAKLLADDELLAFQPVHVTTDHWHGSMLRSDFEKRPIHLEDSEFRQEGVLSVSPDVMDKYGISKTDTLYSEFAFSNTMLDQFSINDMKLTATISSVEDDTGRPCERLLIYLKGEHGFAMIPIAENGCYGELTLIFGRTVQRGKFEDLSKLTADIKQWQSLSIETGESEVLIQLGGNEAHSVPITKDLGALKAVKLLFTGLGAVKELQIQGAQEPVMRLILGQLFPDEQIELNLPYFFTTFCCKP